MAGEVLAEEQGFTYVSVNNTLLQQRLVMQLGAELARRYRAIPLCLPEVSDAARALEADLQAVLDSGRPLTAEMRTRVGQGLSRLRAEVQRAALRP